MTPRRRSGDTPAMLAIKGFGGIIAGLTVAAVSWTGGMLFTLTHRADIVEYSLRFHGLWVGAVNEVLLLRAGHAFAASILGIKLVPAPFESPAAATAL